MRAGQLGCEPPSVASCQSGSTFFLVPTHARGAPTPAGDCAGAAAACVEVEDGASGGVAARSTGPPPHPTTTTVTAITPPAIKCMPSDVSPFERAFKRLEPRASSPTYSRRPLRLRRPRTARGGSSRHPSQYLKWREAPPREPRCGQSAEDHGDDDELSRITHAAALPTSPAWGQGQPLLARSRFGACSHHAWQIDRRAEGVPMSPANPHGHAGRSRVGLISGAAPRVVAEVTTIGPTTPPTPRTRTPRTPRWEAPRNRAPGSPSAGTPDSARARAIPAADPRLPGAAAAAGGPRCCLAAPRRKCRNSGT